VNQKQLQFSALLKHLAPYGFEDGSEHPVFGKIEQCLLRWSREGYLVKGKVIDGDYLVSWGGRAEEEIGTQYSIQLIIGDSGADAFIIGVFGADEEKADKIKKTLKRLSAII